MSDKRTLPISAGAKGCLEYLTGELPFSQEIHAYKFALAYALSSGVIPEVTKSSRTTWQNLGSFDPERELYNIVKALDVVPPEVDVWDFIMDHAEAGLYELADLHKQDKLDLAELVSSYGNQGK